METNEFNMTIKVPSNLVLTARLSSGITCVVSISYIVLSILSLIYYFNCETFSTETVGPADRFWTTIYIVYLQSNECATQIAIPELTQSFTVFVLVALTLSFSVLSLITAILLTSMINTKDMTQYVKVYVYAYIGSWVAMLVVDLTLGTHLGMDITYLSKEMNNLEVYIPMLDILRQGAFYLMAIALKGFAIHAIQLVLMCLIIVYLYDYQDMSKRNEHSVHKVGTINAFEQPRRPDENWINADMYTMESFARGHLNNNFVDDNARPQQNDLYNNSRGPGSFRRSDSWNHQGPSGLQQPSNSSARPFSYLEDVRRPPAVKPVSTAWLTPRVPQSSWGPSAPRVPAPDYSPPRRLKSALKPNYA